MAWSLMTDEGNEPLAFSYLEELVARGCRPLTLRSYAYDLLDWYRFLTASGKPPLEATREDTRRYVLDLKDRVNPYRSRKGAARPGEVNPITGKATLPPGYQPRTINHRLTVIRSFYEHLETHVGLPDGNPVPLRAVPGQESSRHRSPMERPRRERRIAYSQRVPRRTPRSIPERQWDQLVQALSSDRDRALVETIVSCGGRASEVLALTVGDISWGAGKVYLPRKGSDDRDWIPISPTAVDWLRRYIASSGPRPIDSPVWLTLREPKRPLSYWALRAMLNRANALLGTNWVLHDLRHTCAIRLASDANVPITDVQTIMRHAHLSTTEAYLIARNDDVAERLRRHWSRPSVEPPLQSSGELRYRQEDLEILLGTKK